MKRAAGMTLMELMIATFIVSVGVLAAVWSFQYISTSIQHSKSRTLSNNLGQEQIEKLKNLSYYSLLVTLAPPTTDPHFPSITYDPTFYPPQTLIEGGIAFTRATRVDYAIQNGSNITLVPPSTEDTGLKQITVYTIWQEAGSSWQYKEIHNLMANPATNPLNATLTGTVKTVTNVAIPHALVQAIDNPQFYAYTNNSGIYSFTVSEGSYTLRASSQGYFTQDSPGYIRVTSGGSNGYNFLLGLMAKGAATGYVYRNDHVVISQVVGSTANSSGFCQEYVELHNPTTSYVQMVMGMAINLISLKVQRWADAAPTTVGLDFTIPSSSIPPHGYFLIANTPIVTAAGVARTADAVYNAGNTDYPNIIRTADASCGSEPADGDADSVGIAWTASGDWIDRVGWTINPGIGHTPHLYEGSPIPQTTGLEDTEQYIRWTTPGMMNPGYGRAYDSNNNNADFDVVKPLTYPPHNRTIIENPQSGTPAAGAIVNFNDPLSNTAACDNAGRFSSPGVATGTWTMSVSSGNLFAQVSNVSMQASISTGVPNGSTTPTWTAVGGLTNTLLTDTTIFAFVSGLVQDATLAPLNHIEVIDGNGRSTFSSPNGQYLLLASTGLPVQITANPNDSSMNKSYVTVSRSAQTLAQGMLYDEVSWPSAPAETTDFTLSLGGILVGYYKSSSNTSIPGRVAVAFDPSCSGTSLAQAISDSTGHFYLLNLSTGSYCIQPSLDPAEAVTPLNATPVTLAAAGLSPTISTFTITGGLSEITGQALIASTTQAITTGVLVVASTVSLGAATLPPQVSGATGRLCNPCYYAASSDGTGVYSLSVRSNPTPYFVYGWHGTTRAGPYSVMVSTPSQIVPPQNLTWP